MNFEEINWNEVWITEMEHWHQSSGKSCKEYWADKKSAEVYSKKHCNQHQQRIDKTIKGLNLTSDSRVLDIGAGPGNIAIPMAKIAKFVTTVEPSKGMNSVMKADIQQQGLGNIINVEQTWEDVNPTLDLTPPYNLVIASMSLGMSDLQAAIEKMNHVCNGVVTLFWHAGTPGWEVMPKALWPKLFGEKYHGGPKSDILFQILYQMGIYPEVSTFSNHFHEIFPTLDDAQDFYCKRFVQIQPEHKPILESYLKEHCLKTEEGFVHVLEHTTMKFLWRTNEISDPKAV